MDSKKLGMFAVAALFAAQANAGETAKKEAKNAVKADGEMVCLGTCAPSCKGKPLDTIKDKAACDAKQGTWTASKDAKPAEGKKDAHKH